METLKNIFYGVLKLTYFIIMFPLFVIGIGIVFIFCIITGRI